MKGFDHQSGSMIQFKDAEIYFEEHGSKTHPVLLFLHGALGNIEDFNGMIHHFLDDEFRILGIDNRGHGKSTLGSHPLSYELLQEEVEAVLNHLNISKLTVLGFSNGGTVAYRLAVFSQLKIDRIITIGAPWCSDQIEHLRAPFSTLTSEVWKRQCPADYSKFKRLSPEPDFDLVFKQAISMALDTSSKSRPNQRVETISCPVLALRGENDPIVSQSNLDELAIWVKDVKTTTISNAGHEVFLDQLPILMEHMKKFLGFRNVAVHRGELEKE